MTYLAGRLDSIRPDKTVIDLGSGFGGPIRQLVADYGCKGVALNASALELTAMAKFNEAEGLADKITPLEGNYEDIPMKDAQVDIAWSQEAFLHCGDRAKLMREVFRILKPGGEFVFADPMATPTAPASSSDAPEPAPVAPEVSTPEPVAPAPVAPTSPAK